jgi:hypothetical protein
MEKDFEYYQFIQDLADGIVSMEEPFPSFELQGTKQGTERGTMELGTKELGTKERGKTEEIEQISSLVDSWNQSSMMTPKQDFESLMDPLLNDYRQAMKRRRTHQEISKIEIDDMIRSFARRFEFKSQARKFFLKTKYIKNDFLIMADALDIPKNEKLSTRFRIVNAILEKI